MAEEWLTIKDAAEFSGYHENYIRRIARAGTIEARKFGPVWQVNRHGLTAYMVDADNSEDNRRGPMR